MNSSNWVNKETVVFSGEGLFATVLTDSSLPKRKCGGLYTCGGRTKRDKGQDGDGGIQVSRCLRQLLNYLMVACSTALHNR